MNRVQGQISTTMQQALTHLKQGKLAAAEAAFEQILKLQPRNADALNFLGIIAAQTQQSGKAVSLFDKALAVDSRNPGIFNNRGLALQAVGDFAAALQSFERAIALKPDHAAAHFNRGNVLKALARVDEAIESYDRAIALHAKFTEAHYNKGVLLGELGRFDEAVASYDRVVGCRSDHAEAFYNRGHALRALGRFDPALQSFDQAIAARNNYPEAYLNRGEVLEELAQPEAALASYEHAIGLRPHYAKALYNRGNVFKALRRFDDAIASYEFCIRLEPDHADAHFNKAMVLLVRGDFDAGWAEHEWRWKSKNGPARHQIKQFAQALWLGREDLEGTTILLHWEQGLGDTIHFCRYAQVLERRGAKVILLVQRRLVEVLANLAGVAQLVAEGDELPNFDVHCPLMSLPLALTTRLETIPSAPRYLSAQPALIDEWHDRLCAKTRPRIGLVWYGNPGHSGDRHRSLALDELLAGLPRDVDYVSLQWELRGVDAVALRANPIMLTFPDPLDLKNTAALIECLDLVICVDTSIAHLSAALGRKTWLLLSADPDWRWLTDRDDSPWYPSMKLYRQQKLDDWSDALERVAADVSALKF